MTRLRTGLIRAGVVLMLAAAGTIAAPTGPAAAAPTDVVPEGSIFGIAVFDRQTGAFTYTENSTRRFRSASVVKILIAVDFLRRHPTFSGSDETRLRDMLRRSDDNAATYFWNHEGQGAIVQRMVTEMGLQQTQPPADAGIWGDTMISAADVVRAYRYLLNGSAIGAYVMGHLRQSEQCAADGFDQSFGIRSAFTSPSAVKQGWSGFGALFYGCPLPPAVVPASNPRTIPSVLHTTGTVGSGDRAIVAVLSEQPHNTASEEAAELVTRVTQRVSVPGASYAPPPAATPGTWFPTWSSGVSVRLNPTTASDRVDTLPAGQEVYVACQVKGQTVQAEGFVNPWWAYIPEWGGYMTNIYVDSPDNILPGVPVCGTGGYPFMTWGYNVVVHSDARLAAPRTATLAGPTEVIIDCQKQGDTVTAEGYTNPWWSKLRGLGYMTNIYVDSPYYRLPNVPVC